MMINSNAELSSPLSESVIALSEDVHDTWRSTLLPGIDTVFSPDVVYLDVDGERRALDIANMAPQELPDATKSVSERTASVILSMLQAYIELDPPDMSSMRLEKMAIMLFAAWDVIKTEPREAECRELTERLRLFPDSSDRVRLLDRRLILAGIASTLDERRYPIWQQYDIDAVRDIPGMRFYAEKGLRMLTHVRHSGPILLNSEIDDLTEL